ncbi:hypothetical protein P8C59_009498 [Phyllachora maydis]|uniref:Cryptochrome DASH n=1 Tax=Phyllachora maydis TaxID=1825666 RepID=A0AAD9IDW7_9PEZI|nr:hypothetical protein P8C59_009498 [Phyllachora maydis]
MAKANIVIYLLRRDLRVADNPVLHRLATSSDHGFTHLLPVYVVPPHQMEVSGFIKDQSRSPFPEAKSAVGGYWRCGPHRAKFVGEAIMDMRESLESIGSGMLVRVGMFDGVLEEARDEKAVASVCQKNEVQFKIWADEKYFIDDENQPFKHTSDLPDVFTTYRKLVEPLNERPKRTLPAPPKASLPPLPDIAIVPSQAKPFTVPADAADFLNCLIAPVKDVLANMAPCAEGAPSAHPFKGGETAAHSRLTHLLLSEGMTKYKDTRNGLVGTEFSTKLSAYLAQGCVTARQIHEQLCAYENGSDTKYGDVPGYGKGENEGTKAVRFELLWRDYMRLCTGKFKHRLFRLDGFRGGYAEAGKPQKWKTANEKVAVADQDPSPERVTRILERFKAGTTGMGLIDASQRELLHTGYTSNRARQNVASFLAKHLGIDWRYGAEWYEMLLVDYDVSSNWANWQYVAGVGNDPRGEARIFNPVKQAFDYDKQGQYVRMWVPEVAKLEKLENVFQAWTASEEDLKEVALLNNVMVTDPIKRIPFSVEGKPKNSKRPAQDPATRSMVDRAVTTAVASEDEVSVAAGEAARLHVEATERGPRLVPDFRRWPHPLPAMRRKHQLVTRCKAASQVAWGSSETQEGMVNEGVAAAGKAPSLLARVVMEERLGPISRLCPRPLRPSLCKRRLKLR